MALNVAQQQTSERWAAAYLQVRGCCGQVGFAGSARRGQQSWAACLPAALLQGILALFLTPTIKFRNSSFFPSLPQNTT